MAPHWADRNTWASGGSCCSSTEVQGTPLLLASALSHARTQRGRTGAPHSPSLPVVPALPHFNHHLCVSDKALPPPAESGWEVGTRHPSSTARQPPPSSPLPWETTWTLASSPAVLGSLGPSHRNYNPRHWAKNTAGAASSWARGRMGACRATRGEGSCGSPPAGDGDRAG